MNEVLMTCYRQAVCELREAYAPADWHRLRNAVVEAVRSGVLSDERLQQTVGTAVLAHREIALGHHGISAIVLYALLVEGAITMEKIESDYGASTTTIVRGLQKAYGLYERNVAVDTENFRKLLISFAEDVRVIMIMIVERLATMRALDKYEPDAQQKIAREVSYLYAPLAHRMGLYAIKTELEDLSLKYTSYDIYKEIAYKLNETKRSRDAYITQFIEPVKKALEAQGLTFSIKGRTKSIHSIWNKMRKQQVPFEKVYDLFAIRVIIDCPEEQEKAACWQAFSVVTNMYSYNINRLRDWISAPKPNGYESLHVTVMGPQGKWVEVQIRTKRMDEVAEKGVAAHWKYKGIKSDSSKMDEWLKNLREILESSADATDSEVINEFKMQLYDDDVFVFTPKGDLHNLPKGATVLDFAFSIHTSIGAHCMGAVVNDKHVSFKYVLQNGDQISVLTSPNQTPKNDWINYVVTTRARTKIRQSIKDIEHKDAEDGREILWRRLKNWKIEVTDGEVTRLSKKMGYKTLTDFYVAIHNGKINVLTLRDKLTEPDETPDTAQHSAGTFTAETELQRISSQGDALVIDRNLKNVDYTLAKCCNPIYGDDIFGFVTINNGIKIHRKNCPNAPQMIEKFGYRIVNARWSGQQNAGGEYPITLRIIGHDDIGIVTNITSVITKENNVNMRSISVDSHDGLFEGNITVMVKEVGQLEQLMRKIRAIKGVKQVLRS
ncbi:MAG: RelA/SpoT family protein [Paludibacteraceae bacterium]|nr:RelA/SpoT family protein [Bacteroidales bacterium]MDY4512398.1 RelA/SpoT family protein [Paludibacteraceae bacterium]MDY4851040.1 RelA/SpoT family protein [Paludibacteraceae bacterium]MDY6036256.1 RelA/SpoT family protein [Paludibacteraceae bacterium]